MLQATCQRDGLLSAAVLASGALGSSSSIPALRSLLLRVDDGCATITGTNLDTWVSASSPCEGEGVALIPSDLLIPALRNCRSGGELRLEAQAEAVKLSCGRTKFDLPTLHSAELPMLSEEFPFRGEMAGEDLARIIGRTAYAVMVGQAINFATCFTGVNLRHRAGKLEAAATNRNHLAQATADVVGFDQFPDVIVPTKAAQEIARLAKAGELLTVEASASLISVSHRSGRVVARLVDARFPDYERLIPEDHPLCAQADGEELAGLLSAAMVVARQDKDRSIRIRFADNAISVVARDMHGTRAASEIDAEYAGEPVELSIMGSQWLDAIRLLTVERVSIAMSDNRAPVLLCGVGETNALTVQMPLRG